MTKQEIRARIRQLKSRLTEAERHEAARSVFSALEQSEIFGRAHRILMYHSLPDELPTHEFIGRWSLCKQIYLPRVNGSELEILPYHRSNLRTGAFSIQEPQGSDVIPPGQMELIVVPGVAFDLEGNRVGRGKGFYDRLLTETHATTIGVAFDFQLLCSVPAEAHDRPLDEIITERRRLTIRK